jgi:hypothetical protein
MSKSKSLIDTKLFRKNKNRYTFGNSSEGIGITLSRKGIEVWGWFDSIVGIEGGFVSWNKIKEDCEIENMP